MNTMANTMNTTITTPHVNNLAWLVQELRRWAKSPLLWLYIVLSVPIVLIGTYGTIEDGSKKVENGFMDPADLTEMSLHVPLIGTLITILLSVIIVSYDFDTKFSTRLLALNRAPIQLVVVKTFVAMLLSVIIGGATLITGRWATHDFLTAKGIDFSSQMDLGAWVGRYTALYALSAVWGIAIALIFRSMILTLSFHIVYQTIVEATIIQAFPNVGKWLPGGAQAAIVNNPSLPERLGFVPGLGLYFGWLLVLMAIGCLLLLRSPQGVGSVQELWYTYKHRRQPETTPTNTQPVPMSTTD